MKTQKTKLPLHHRAVYLSKIQAFTRKGGKSGTSPCGVDADSRWEDAEFTERGQAIS